VFRLLYSGTPGNIQPIKDIHVTTAVLSGDIPLKNFSPPGCIYSVLENASTRTLHTGALRKMNILACVQRWK